MHEVSLPRWVAERSLQRPQPGVADSLAPLGDSEGSVPAPRPATPTSLPTALDDAKAHMVEAYRGDTRTTREEDLAAAQASALISIAEALHQLTRHNTTKEQP